MAAIATHRATHALSAFDLQKLMREQGAIDAARRVLPAAVAAPFHWREDVMAMLMESLASEMMCVLHHTWRRLEANGHAAREFAQEFPPQYGEFCHAVRLAQHIVQFGGRPNFHPDAHGRCSHAGYSDSADLTESVKANLAVTQLALARFGEIITLINCRGASVPEQLEEILAETQEHADELEYWLAH